MHIDYGHTKKEILTIVRKFCKKMEDSGYKQPAREETIRWEVKKYWRMRLQEALGVRDLYRSR